PESSSVIRPEEVCMSVTNSFMFARAAAEGLMTMSMPSSRGLSSKSVTIAATSMSSSLTSSRPVISQSIHTILLLLTRPACARGAGGRIPGPLTARLSAPLPGRSLRRPARGVCERRHTLSVGTKGISGMGLKLEESPNQGCHFARLREGTHVRYTFAVSLIVVGVDVGVHGLLQKTQWVPEDKIT